MMEVNLAGSYTVYKEGVKNFDYDALYGIQVTVQEAFTKPILVFAVGLNFNFNAGK